MLRVQGDIGPGVQGLGFPASDCCWACSAAPVVVLFC